jgi:hypothetical protein
MTSTQLDIIKKEILKGLQQLANTVETATEDEMQELLESPFVHNVEIMHTTGNLSDVRKFKLSVRPLPNLSSHVTRDN